MASDDVTRDKTMPKALTKTDPALPRTNAYRIRVAALSVLLVAAAGWGGVYGIGGFMRNAQAQTQCAPAVDLARRISPLVKGEVAALTMATAPLQIPDLAFQDAEGKTRKLSEWKGRTVLVNLWATWCVPCRKEMPALDKLQQTLGDKDFEVVAINIDTRDPEKPKAFLKEAGLTTLAYFHDQKAKVFQDLKSTGRALGMPTSVLIDGAGCEIGTIAGPAEWASDDAIKLIKAATAK